MAEIITLAEKASHLGLATLLIIILVGGFRKWWVYGWQLTEAQAKCAEQLAASAIREEDWKALALGGNRVADKAVGLAKDIQRER